MPVPDRIAFSLFGFDIMWYGILVATGIALCVAIPYRRAPKHGLSSDKFLNYAIVIVLAGIVGTRLYYVLFNLSYFAEDWARVFRLREGGLAIHGGLISGVLAALILCRIWKDAPLNFLDLGFASVPLGQAVGRWGNYFNSEAHGGPTDLPWAITVEGVKVHPTFLYESIWCFFLFLFLIWVDNRRQFEGQTALLYAILYSFERFFVEGLRTDSLMAFGVIRQAQALSAIVFFGGILAYFLLYKRYKRRRRSDAPEVKPQCEDAGGRSRSVQAFLACLKARAASEAEKKTEERRRES
ncbi:MAG: prolipoprotein diacylglyceryl transferase [Clostridiales Family XIII bacterium]|jgi:phosphatidylglycerol:prolipoprotein diacylglycerol transferase|nr:prolipoprotein diacylglyceryl transferase [Clostridiales Family XIII bacterium]